MKNLLPLIAFLVAATTGRAQDTLQCYLAPNDWVYCAGQRIQMDSACIAGGGSAALYHRQKGRWEPYPRGAHGLFVVSRIVREPGGPVFFYMKWAPGKDPVVFRLEASRVLAAGSCFRGDSADTAGQRGAPRERLRILQQSGQISATDYAGGEQSLREAFGKLDALRRRRDSGEMDREAYFREGQELLNQAIKR